MLRAPGFPTICCNPHGYQLRPTVSRPVCQLFHILIFLRERDIDNNSINQFNIVFIVNFLFLQQYTFITCVRSFFSVNLICKDIIYIQFLKQGELLTNKLKKREYQQSRLKSFFRMFYGRQSDLVSIVNLPVGCILIDVFRNKL